MHRDRAPSNPWSLVVDCNLLGVLRLYTAHKLLDNRSSGAARLLCISYLVQHLHARVYPALLHSDFLVEFHDFLHQLHHCQVLNRHLVVE